MSKENTRKIVSFDWAIKYILRDKANFGILEGFLLALLKEEFKIEEILESEGNQTSMKMKFNRVDIIAETSKGEHIIIEVQYAPEQHFFKRLLFGTSKDIVDNIDLGKDYGNVKKVYSIAIVYFDIEDHESENYEEIGDYVFHGHYEFFGLHNNKKIKLNKHCLIGYEDAKKEDINIFPEYFIIPVRLFDNKINDDLDEWIYAFSNSKVKDNFKAKGIDLMAEKLDYVSLNDEERQKYDKHQMDLASDKGVIAYAIEKAEKKVEKEKKKVEKEKKKVETEKKKVEKEKKKVETANKRAEKEKQRAEKEKQRAEKEKQRAEKSKKELENNQKELEKQRKLIADLMAKSK